MSKPIVISEDTAAKALSAYIATLEQRIKDRGYEHPDCYVICRAGRFTLTVRSNGAQSQFFSMSDDMFEAADKWISDLPDLSDMGKDFTGLPVFQSVA